MHEVGLTLTHRPPAPQKGQLQAPRKDWKAAREFSQQAPSPTVQRFGKEHWRVTDVHLALADVERHTGSKVFQRISLPGWYTKDPREVREADGALRRAEAPRA